MSEKKVILDVKSDKSYKAATKIIYDSRMEERGRRATLGYRGLTVDADIHETGDLSTN